jgi:hypothetical protein
MILYYYSLEFNISYTPKLYILSTFLYFLYLTFIYFFDSFNTTGNRKLICVLFRLPVL